jgi:hypothetical protein
LRRSWNNAVDIQQVVPDLERDPQRAPVGLEGVQHGGRRPGDLGHRGERGGDDRRRLPLDHAEVMLAAGGEIEARRLLEDLALHQVGARLAAAQDDRLRVLGGELERPNEEVVPAHDRERHAERSGHRRAAPPGLGVVDDVVVHERGGVDQLEGRREGLDRTRVRRAEGAETDRHEQRPHPLTAHRAGVACGFGELGVRRPEDLVDPPVDLRQVPDEQRQQLGEFARGLVAERLGDQHLERRLDAVPHGGRAGHEFLPSRGGQRSRIMASRPAAPI